MKHDAIEIVMDGLRVKLIEVMVEVIEFGESVSGMFPVGQDG